MKCTNNRYSAGLLAALLLPFSATAQPFDLSWHTLDGGGDMFGVGGAFELSGTIGQYDASPVMTGGTFEVTGGFWAGVDLIPCPADLDGDDDVDLADLTQLLSHFGLIVGATHADGDLDGDGDVDIGDLSLLLSLFGTICS